MFNIFQEIRTFNMILGLIVQLAETAVLFSAPRDAMMDVEGCLKQCVPYNPAKFSKKSMTTKQYDRTEISRFVYSCSRELEEPHP
jgi:hypothetical protein